MTGSQSTGNMRQPILPEALLDGYAAFTEGRLPAEKQRFETLAEIGQFPENMIISCCDSRVTPEAIFNTGPGQLFVARNVANLVPPMVEGGESYEISAAIEFAVLGLKVRNIVVMGHGRCGGVQNYLHEKETSIERTPLSSQDAVGFWTKHLEPAWRDSCCGSDADAETQQRMLEEASIKMSLENLMTYPYVEKRVSVGNLNLYGAWFDISSGDFFALDRASGEFKKVK